VEANAEKARQIIGNVLTLESDESNLDECAFIHISSLRTRGDYRYRTRNRPYTLRFPISPTLFPHHDCLRLRSDAASGIPASARPRFSRRVRAYPPTSFPLSPSSSFYTVFLSFSFLFIPRRNGRPRKASANDRKTASHQSTTCQLPTSGRRRAARKRDVRPACPR